MRHAIVDSPIGELLLLGDDDGTLCGLRMAPFERPPGSEPDDGALAAAAQQLGEYFAGERRAFDLPLAMGGTPFQCEVWEQLRAIPYGETISYGELARRVGRPDAMRAVGAANGRNPIAVIVPCHRVIGADGSLTGYGGGLERKRALLELEAGAAALF